MGFKKIMEINRIMSKTILFKKVVTNNKKKVHIERKKTYIIKVSISDY